MFDVKKHCENVRVMWAKKVIYGFAIVFLLFLSINSFIYSSDGYELTVNTAGRIIMEILCAVWVFGICWLLSYCLERCPKICSLAGGIFLFLAVIFFSAWWIRNSANLPQSDARSVYDIAYRAMNHDLLPIAPVGSYMSLWPFQSGLVMFMEMILRLVPNADEMTIQWAYMPFLALSLISGYMVVRRMSVSKRTRIFWCILMGLCLPYYFYINNMYGEIPSIAGILFCLWMLMEYFRKPAWIKLALAFCGVGGAQAVRKNTTIFVIACIIIVAVVFLAEQQKKNLVVIGVIIAAAVAGSILPARFYEYRAKNTMGKGVPAIAYVAMGLQWSEGRDPGGWNGYHSDLFMECGFDAELTAEISSEAVKDSLSNMVKNPAYMAEFFYTKLVAQWEREDYMCLYETLDFYGDRTEAAWDIYEGKAKDKLLYFMALHQSIVYIGACCFCVIDIVKRKKDARHLFLMLTFIGGFLFSVIWEAQSRYVMPYFVMLIPYAADGLAGLSYGIERRIAVLRRNGDRNGIT